MKKIVQITIPVLMILMSVSSVSFAQVNLPEPTHIPFQGVLKNSTGEPIPDGTIEMTFHLYADSIGGQSIWTETRQVTTRNGLFNITLGDINPFSLDNFAEPLYLETQVGVGNPPLNGRIHLGSTATSGSSQRVTGDVFTGPGSIRMFAPQPEPPSPDPLMLMETGIGGDASIRMFAPQPEPPYPDPTEILSINSSPSTGASIRMFAPQPEPPSPDPLLLMETGVGGEASIRMFAPQPEPPSPDPTKILNISSSPVDGGSFEMFAPQAETGMLLVNRNPQIRLNCDNARSSLLVQRARDIVGSLGDSTGVSVRADSITSNLSLFLNNSDMARISAQTIDGNQGGGLSLFSNGSEYMGIGPSPFHSGGDLVMSDSDGVNTMAFSSLGKASFFSGGTEYMGIDPSPFGGTLNMLASNGNIAIQLASDGSSSFFNSGTEYMGIEPVPFGGSGGTLKMYSGVPIQSRVILSSDGKLSLGTGSTTNILTIQQSSPTDPIADSWTVYSSRRWKTNIQPIQNALDKVMRLNGVTYNWIENGKHDIGLIAEEVGQVVPEIVAYEENGIDAKSVDYARLTALLIEGMKEQQKEIDKLKTEIDELKHKGASK